MNTRTYLIGAAIAAVFGCTSVHAQVLGGGLGGGLNGSLGGTLNGGTHPMDVITQGSADGTLGGRLDTGSLHRTTRDTADRTTGRVRDTAGRVRNRTESTAGRARDVGTSTAASAVGTATSTVDARKVAAATNVAGSAAGDLSAQGANVAGAAEGAAQQGTIVTPDLGKAPSLDGVKGSAPQPSEAEQPAPRALNVGSSLGGEANSDSLIGNDARMPLSNDMSNDMSNDTSASGSGSASASRHGVSAQSSAAAQSNNSASVSTQR